MAYIVNGSKIIAKIQGASSTSGAIRYSFQRSKEVIDAAREWNLVNAANGRIAQGKTWDAKWSKIPCGGDCYAQEINPGEFFVQ